MRISRRDILTAGVGALTAAAAPRALAAWEPSDRYPDPAIQILDPSFAKYRLNNAGIERLAVGMRWAEGPVWFGDGRYLLWSDAALDRITRWDEETGQASIFRRTSPTVLRATARAGCSPASTPGDGSRARNT